MLLMIRSGRQNARSLISPPSTKSNSNKVFFFLLYSTRAAAESILTSHPYQFSSQECFHSSASCSSSIHTSNAGVFQLKDVVLSFKEWFQSRLNPDFDRIFEILRTKDEASADLALSRFNLRLSESLVLEILNYEKGKDVLSCLKFFDWAGRQPGFYHTQATFSAIFKILSKAKLTTLMIEFLEKYAKQRYIHRLRFYNTLVIGYSIAGKPEVALQLFGRMRFTGADLDYFAYHVLLNALVEDEFYDAVDMVLREIKLHGFENSVTHSIFVKSLCKQRELDKAEAYIRGLLGNGGAGLSGIVVATVVDALSKNRDFEKAGLLVEEFRESGLVSMEHAYGAWINNLVRAGKLDGALEFLKNRNVVDGHVPRVFRYNGLVCKLLRENRLEEVYDWLMEMKDQGISPDEVTMNVTVCFFCKVGMVDVALELYDARSEFELSVNSMAYNYLINTLLGDSSNDDACRVLRNGIEQGYFPGRRTFSIIANSLCKEGKLDRVNELILAALDHNHMPSDIMYNRFISALCRAHRVEDGFLLHEQLSRLNKVTSRNTYFDLISGCVKSSRADIAARLLIEMQENGHSANSQLYRAVICCLCQLNNPEKQFFRLMEMQLSRFEPTCKNYNFFIDGAGHAGKPELAKEVYEMMEKTGTVPTLNSHVLLLHSYLKNGRISEALNFFYDLSKRGKTSRKLWHCLIVGLCKVGNQQHAWDVFWKMRAEGKKPSLESYEELVNLLCSHKQYYWALIVVDDLLRSGRKVSSFIGNVLLLHSLRTKKLYDLWLNSRNDENTTIKSLKLGKLMETFSGCSNTSMDINEIEELIQQCFPLDIYTYNLLLRRLSMCEVDYACGYFNTLRKKGYEPNRWSYDIIVHGLSKCGRTSEARKWIAEMLGKGYDLTEATEAMV
ncbi:PREDICTED: pentatricopeptide repeat-containing protein At1g71210 [Ipomoea nil]|uniref:pentatricopeptide repeat-containing protein At1g71210 n=1 Tax=Ipomoea nil TaxID=35883 RepID=UPI000900AEB1|nr:PREDICTED: pentatricopeptide repeat-containing protein At1g71210 [Ipomoea nil]XP_019193845.1 PREDICTED: pentatricopeptide repeat-containing protein At1g71210 [Ipomoea nil]